MNINIQTIPHQQQRYETVGDYFTTPAFECRTCHDIRHFRTESDYHGGTIRAYCNHCDGDEIFIPREDIPAETAVRVSRMGNDDYEFLVALHELIELHLCKKRGITHERIDEFDRGYEAAREVMKPDDTSEPGDHAAAPYALEHAFATKLERLMADELGVDWVKYSDTVNAL